MSQDVRTLWRDAYKHYKRYVSDRLNGILVYCSRAFGMNEASAKIVGGVDPASGPSSTVVAVYKTESGTLTISKPWAYASKANAEKLKLPPFGPPEPSAHLAEAAESKDPTVERMTALQVAKDIRRREELEAWELEAWVSERRRLEGRNYTRGFLDYIQTNVAKDAEADDLWEVPMLRFRPERPERPDPDPYDWDEERWLQ